MYNCQQTSELLGIYLDNELDAMPTRGVAEHLEQCASCRRELELMRFQQASLVHSIQSITYDTEKLRSAVEMLTIRNKAIGFFDLKLSRVPVWALTAVALGAIAFLALFYLPGRLSSVSAHPLYQAAGGDHLNCSGTASDHNWIDSQPAIVREVKAFLRSEADVPLTINGEFVLARARHCRLNDHGFLHLIYETADHREASLFLCNSASWIPAGHRQLTLSGRTAQLTDVSQLTVAGLLAGDCLAIAAARDEKVSVALLEVFNTK